MLSRAWNLQGVRSSARLLKDIRGVAIQPNIPAATPVATVPIEPVPLPEELRATLNDPDNCLLYKRRDAGPTVQAYVGTSLIQDSIDAWLSRPERKRGPVIIVGPPGTGKTVQARYIVPHFLAPHITSFLQTKEPHPKEHKHSDGRRGYVHTAYIDCSSIAKWTTVQDKLTAFYHLAVRALDKDGHQHGFGKTNATAANIEMVRGLFRPLNTPHLVVLDEFLSLFATVPPKQKQELSEYFREMYQDTDSRCQFVINSAAGPALLASFGLSDQMSVLDNACLIKGAHQASDDEVHDLLTIRKHLGMFTPDGIIEAMLKRIKTIHVAAVHSISEKVRQGSTLDDAVDAYVNQLYVTYEREYLHIVPPTDPLFQMVIKDLRDHGLEPSKAHGGRPDACARHGV